MQPQMTQMNVDAVHRFGQGMSHARPPRIAAATLRAGKLRTADDATMPMGQEGGSGRGREGRHGDAETRRRGEEPRCNRDELQAECGECGAEMRETGWHFRERAAVTLKQGRVLGIGGSDEGIRAAFVGMGRANVRMAAVLIGFGAALS